MERVIHLRGAAVTLCEDKILIKEGGNNHRNLYLLTAFIWLVVAAINTWSYLDSGEGYKLFTIGISVLLFLINLRWLWLSDAREILLSEVKSVKFRSSFLSGETLNLKLNNGRHREVNNITPVSDELQKYFAERGL